MEILYAILGAIGIFILSAVISIVLVVIIVANFPTLLNKKNTEVEDNGKDNIIKKILQYLFFIVMTILTINMLKQDNNTPSFWSGCILVFMYVCKFYWSFFDNLMELFGHKHKNNTGNF